MEQAEDFRVESARLDALIAPLNAAALAQPTGFKGWTIATIIGHLHVWNRAAELALTDRDGFAAFVAGLGETIRGGGDLPAFERQWLGDPEPRALVHAWREGCATLAQRFADADPAQRVPWVGPEMSARSAITARLMESWAHGQAVFDRLGVVRGASDGAIANIARLGCNTYGWTFRNRGEAAPEPMPYVDLVLPSGAPWRFGTPDPANQVQGSAEQFCQVVTQTRNIADTALRVAGDGATRWMAIAQCFAGRPVDPPAPGTRRLGS